MYWPIVTLRPAVTMMQDGSTRLTANTDAGYAMEMEIPMRHLLRLLILLTISSGAYANSCYRGVWNADKYAHVAFNAGIVSMVGSFSGSEVIGIGAAVGVSALREFYKYQHQDAGYRCSWTSIAADAVGIGIGHWVLMPRDHGAAVVYNMELK
jgi:hypothetical protein